MRRLSFSSVSFFFVTSVLFFTFGTYTEAKTAMSSKTIFEKMITVQKSMISAELNGVILFRPNTSSIPSVTNTRINFNTRFDQRHKNTVFSDSHFIVTSETPNGPIENGTLFVKTGSNEMYIMEHGAPTIKNTDVRQIQNVWFKTKTSSPSDISNNLFNPGSVVLNKTYKQETIEGEPCYHITGKAKHKDLKTIAKDLGISQDNALLKSYITQANTKQDTFTLDFWVNKKTFLLKRITANWSSGDIAVSLKNINKQMSIRFPQTSFEVSHMFSMLNTPFLDTDKDGLADLQESMIGTNANNTDSDGYKDGQEMYHGYNPMMAP